MTLPPAELLRARVRALAGMLPAERVDALLVTRPANIAYLSGFFGSAGFVLALPDGLILGSDSRYAETLDQLARAVPSLNAVVAPAGGSHEELVVDQIRGLGIGRVGFETRSMTVHQHADLVARLHAAGVDREVVATDGLVERLRLVKDAWEIATLREAGRRLSDVAKCIIPKVLDGCVEREVAAEIEWELRQKGFEKPAFDTIVASGPNAALPHYRAGERRLENGDVVVVDFGGVFRGYAVDMTRTVVLGVPTPRQRQCLVTVAEAQRAAFAAAMRGTPTEDVDAAARKRLAQAGMAEAFGHGLGHGLGLEVHELPRLAQRRAGTSLGRLQAGMVFTLEPGVYFPGWGGVRIEDDVLATDAGPEWLTEPVAEVRTI